MKRSSALSYLLGAIFSASLAGSLAAMDDQPQAGTRAVDPDLGRFALEKRKLVKTLADKHGVKVPTAVSEFFEAVMVGDLAATTKLAERFWKGRDDPTDRNRLPDPLWSPVHETFGASDQFYAWSPQLLRMFGHEIISHIPPGSVYLGGTDAGRFIISSLSRSHTKGNPFYTITQNALVDGRYLDYLRDIYGGSLVLPGAEEMQAAFSEYTQDASKRMQSGKLSDGEEVRKSADNRLHISGVVAVMRMNEILVRGIIDKNPDRKFFLEESYVLASLYPLSTPHGLIFQVHHSKVESLPEETIETDRRFWANKTKSLVGLTVEPATSVEELCAWADRVRAQGNLAISGGSPGYAKDREAQVCFAKCRCAQASLFEWWSKEARTPEESKRFGAIADRAYREAFVLMPTFPEGAWRYARFLENQGRKADLKILVGTVLKSDPTIPTVASSDVWNGSRKRLQAKAAELGIKE